MATAARPDRARFDIVLAPEPDIKPEEITELILNIGQKYGCRTCGLIGVDLFLTGDHPGELEQTGSVRSIVAP